MKTFAVAAIGVALLASPVAAQDGDGSGEIIVTAMRRQGPNEPVISPPPVIGLRRLADSAVRDIEITSDSREVALRQREVQAMLLAAIDRAAAQGFSLVTGELEVVEVTRANWQDQFPGLAGKPDDEEEDDDDDDDKPKPAFEDYAGTTTIRLKVKTRLDGSIGNARAKIAGFVKSVPVTGRSQIAQKGRLALTIVKPEQYRDELYARIAAGAKRAASLYETAGLTVTGLDQAVAWKQVSNIELFVYIPYGFVVEK